MIVTNDNIKAIAQAIQSLTPNARWTNSESGDIQWLDAVQTQPSDSELTTEMDRLQAEYDSQEYARNRKAEYDQLNQFEMQFDDDRDGTTTWVDTINEIKGRHPK